MKIIIAGSRNITNSKVVEAAIQKSGWLDKHTEIVSGMARGVDQIAVRFAQKHGYELYQFPADWKKYGISAGPIRNCEMAEFADALIAVWDGRSVGTKNMIDVAQRKGLKCFIYRTDQEN